MKTGKEYIDSIKAMNFELYIDGGKITNIYDHPKIRPAIDAVAESYEFAFKTELREQFVTKSHLTGETISSFQHVPRVRMISSGRSASPGMPIVTWAAVPSVAPKTSLRLCSTSRRKSIATREPGTTTMP